MLTFQMDRRALGFSFIVAVVSAVLFGLVPAIQATRTDLTAVMKASDSVAPGRRRRWGRTILVGGQVPVSVVVLVVAMFMYRAFGAQLSNGPGYRIDHLLMMGFDPSLVRYSEEQSQQFFRAGRRAGACGPRRHERHDDDVHSDVERLDRLDDDCTGRLSVPSRQGQRHDSLVESRRILFRHDGHPAAPGPQLHASTTTKTRRASPSSTSSSPGTTGRIRIRSASAFG